MIALGAASLVCALLTALAAAGLAIRAGTSGDRRYTDASRRAMYALCALLTICVAVIEAAFLRSDLTVELVADHSSTTTPTFYKVTALWSSQGGSLLLWAWVLSIASSVVLFGTRTKHREIVPWATAVLAGLAVFFCGLMVLADPIGQWIGDPSDRVNPFARLDPAPAEGAGLNPLLRHPMMAIHPVALYSGYVAFSIPFAFAIGALITRRLDASWIRSTRRFALAAWTLLGAGLLLGANWSYAELGWGGYWGWDPVENAALMPWLMGTAFLHSIMVQERRGMLKVWNVSLIVATFALALLGTFIVRSGVLQSIHAFGDSTVGPPLLALIATVLIGSTALIVSRLGDLRSERRIDSLLSRETVFLINNLLLVGLVAVIFWGTFFPLISEAVTGEESSLAAPWFNDYTTPLAIALVLFTGIGPLLAWRRLSAQKAVRTFAFPVVVAVVVTIAVAALGDALSEPGALILFCFAAFALAALAQEFWRGASARRALAGGSWPGALVAVVGRNRRRYGGYVAHAGFIIAMIAIAASSSFQTSRDVTLQPGESATVGDYELTYVRSTQSIDPAEQRLTLGSIVDVRRDGEAVGILTPSRNYYSSRSTEGVSGFFEGEATSEVGRRTGLGGDLWTAMQPDLNAALPILREADAKIDQQLRDLPPMTPETIQARAQLEGQAVQNFVTLYAADPPPANFRVNVNPLVVWLWLGGGIAIAGALIAIWPSPSARRRRVSDVYAARLARDLGSA